MAPVPQFRCQKLHRSTNRKFARFHCNSPTRASKDRAHVTPLTESGSTGPFDGWPLGRGFDRYYGFLDAETDQYAPELVLDNSSIGPPGTFESGYHLTADLIDKSIRFLAGHVAEEPETPWLLWLALGATHAPHQAPRPLIESYDAVFAPGWDEERQRRIARQKTMGIVPEAARLPPRNDGVRAWTDHTADERRFTMWCGRRAHACASPRRKVYRALQATIPDVLYCTPMAQTDLERFTRIMLDEFGRVHERLDRHDDRFDNFEAELRSIRSELKSIRNELDELPRETQKHTPVPQRD